MTATAHAFIHASSGKDHEQRRDLRDSLTGLDGGMTMYKPQRSKADDEIDVLPPEVKREAKLAPPAGLCYSPIHGGFELGETVRILPLAPPRGPLADVPHGATVDLSGYKFPPEYFDPSGKCQCERGERPVSLHSRGKIKFKIAMRAEQGYTLQTAPGGAAPKATAPARCPIHGIPLATIKGGNGEQACPACGAGLRASF